MVPGIYHSDGVSTIELTQTAHQRRRYAAMLSPSSPPRNRCRSHHHYHHQHHRHHHHHIVYDDQQSSIVVVSATVARFLLEHVVMTFEIDLFVVSNYNTTRCSHKLFKQTTQVGIYYQLLILLFPLRCYHTRLSG